MYLESRTSLGKLISAKLSFHGSRNPNVGAILVKQTNHPIQYEKNAVFRNQSFADIHARFSHQLSFTKSSEGKTAEFLKDSRWNCSQAQTQERETITWNDLCRQAAIAHEAVSMSTQTYFFKTPLRFSVQARHDESLLIHLNITETCPSEQQNTTDSILANPVIGFCCSRMTDGKILIANKRFTEIFGCTTDGAKSTRDYYANQDYRSLILAELCEFGSVRLHRVKVKREDGAFRWVQLNSYLFSEEGVIESFLLDVTEEKEAMDNLAESERRFGVMLEMVKFASLTLDYSGKVTSCNDTFLSLTGWTREELLLQDFCNICVPPEHQAEMRSFHRELVTGKGQSSHYYVNQLLTKGGRCRDMFWNFTTLRDQHGNVVGAASLGEELSEREQVGNELNNCLQQLQDSLETAVTALSRTAAWRDPYTAKHQRCVAELASAIAVEMGLSDLHLAGYRTAALLHDIGKLAIPLNPFCKPEEIQWPEFEIVKSHSKIRDGVAQEVKLAWPIAKIILHHERTHGGGYPYELQKHHIVLGTKILMVADVVGTMAYKRPYRPALGLDAAINEISRYAGTIYDADVVTACVRILSDSEFVSAWLETS